MLVVATKLGYYNLKRRRPGEVFKIKDKSHLSKVWMKPHDAGSEDFGDEETAVKEPKPARKGKALKSKEEVIDETYSGDDEVI